MKTCKKCHKRKPLKDFYPNNSWSDGRNSACRECVKKYERVRHQTWYRSAHQENQKRHKRKRKQELIDAYGGRCSCCGETYFEFLQLDHVDGKGKVHRQSIGAASVYTDLRNRGYPKKGYRLLCANCNFSLGIYGYCPHANLPVRIGK